ncbi:MAG TPA: two-component regulator propeller domain-containing protein [Blastocatellia bacterium]|nr:two-component regulator propeller domain-containing protein [Blastocatellia bacterium]HMZ20199.1 two-component regulator propeller domain-containing protein [Blastocatellia bacterium]HNG34192.1 two-component regulator propeller domain-containing protein [Blastocatellia bacterium]
MNSKRLIITLLLLSCRLVIAVQGQTFSPQKALGQYQQFVWLEQHGLPQNTVQAVTRTRDGYLWLGTLAGVARFDGVHFTVFDNGNTAEIKGSYITALLEDHAGRLWIGTEGGGLNLYRNGRFSLYGLQQGLPDDHVRALLEDREGNLWIATNGGLVRFNNERFTVITARDGLPSDHVGALALDRVGALWVGTSEGLAHFKDGRFTKVDVHGALPSDNVRSLYWDRADNLWIGTDEGLSRFKDGRFTVEGVKDGLTRHQVLTIYQDRDDNIWVGTIGGGLFRFKDGRVARYTTKDGAPGDRVVAVYQDPEGDLWVGTDGGLIQFHRGPFRAYTPQDGLAQDFTSAVYEDSAGALWIAAVGALSRFKDGVFTVYTPRDGLPTQNIRSICEDRAGNLWLGSYGGGIARFKDGRFTAWTTKDGLANDLVYGVLTDRAGDVWAATFGGGVSLFRNGRFTNYTARDGLGSNDVKTLFEDRAGNLWFGTQSGGISQFKDGRFTTWTTKDGLASDYVLSFFEDHAGGLWISTQDGGLSRFKNGKFAVITAKDGLYDNLAFRMLLDTEDDSGNLWMSCNKGIYRVSLKELNDFADGRIKSVTSFAYGVGDGMLSRECNGACPAGWRTHDGRLWFPTTRGVVTIDPQQRSLQPPTVVIEQVMLDHTTRGFDHPLRINPGEGNLEIQYAALSWNRPQQIRFKYQLAGLDTEWTEAGTRRTAYFPHLPSGTYTFKVIADNGEGVWSAEGRELRIVVLPPFYRTWWFLALAVTGATGLAAFAYQYRLRQLRRVQAAQQVFAQQLIASQEAERKRIASELHDSLGQHLLIIKNRVALSLRLVTEPSPIKEQLDEINESATQAISEARTIAHNLRPINVERLGLTAVLEDMIEKVAAASGVQISADIEALDGLFTPEAEISLFRIVQESVNNIVKHAQATKAYVEIWREDGHLRATVRDNGCGFDLTASKSGGLGLTGIVERVRTLGGTHTINSAPGEGTTLNIRIPL